MRHIWPTTLRGKLIALITGSLLLGETLVALVSAHQEITRYAAQKSALMAATAQVLAAAAARPASEGDVGGIYATLRAMGRIEGITFVGVLAPDGRLVADLGATEQLATDAAVLVGSDPIPLGRLLRSRSVEIGVPIVHGGETVGQLRMIADTTDLPPRLWRILALSLVMGAASLLLAVGVALVLQRGITEPLRKLTATMSRVKTSHDYSLALPPAGHGEVGILVDGFNAMIADIRARDARLAAHRARLEQDVAERTVDFQRAAAEASAANAAKTAFLATMSHEIRTPMNGILVMAELLAAADLPKGPRRHADVIAKAGQSLLAIINDILDMSKIEAGKLEVETLPLDPIEAGETVARLFGDRAFAKGLDLAVCAKGVAGLRVLADPVRLGQVLANLVNNALKFTENGHVLLDIARDGDDPCRLRFSVTDTGIGIAADKLGTIFEAFSQADETTTRRFGGTGLGLAIGRRLVAAMGGELAVTSVEGQGSTFHFSLPFAQESESPLPAAPGAGANRRVLVALSGAASVRAAAATFSEAGFACEIGTISTIEAACAALAPEDLVLVDGAVLAARGRPETGARLIALVRPGEHAPLADGTIEAPLARADLLALADPSAPQERDRAAATPAPRFAGARVLVADDAAVNREVAEAALGRLGITPSMVENGRDAVQAVAAGRFDLVLMDGSMPELDGYEATRRIRAREAAEGLPHLPIVALTAHVVGPTADAWRDAGMDGVLHKPFTLDQLAACLGRFLDAKDADSLIEARREGEAEPEAPPLIDLSALEGLREMAGGASDVVVRVVRLYRQHAPQKIDALRAAMAGTDRAAIASAAHALKSMSLNIGARAVAVEAARIERIADFETGTIEPPVVEHLATLTDQTCAALLPHAA